MRAYVVVATKGRPREVAVLIDYLRRQTRQPELIVVVGAGPADLGTLADTHPEGVQLIVSDRAGLTIQRNAGIKAVQAHAAGERYFIAYFDDDYRPADTWLEEIAKAFEADPSLAGLTGRILADGVRGAGISEDDAVTYLKHERTPMRHWATGEAPWDTSSAYGCNMAFVDRVCEVARFDENLPLYAWQEDRDYTSQALAYGRVLYWPSAEGVHMGAKNGRSPGTRLGYSQVANLVYLARKGTIKWSTALDFIARNFVANHLKVFFPEPWTDRPGLIRGNWTALKDFAFGRIHPMRILEL